ncbi:Ferrichrome-iron receptor precursor [Sporomusa ovata DSM 2662]|uniref:Ferrichrome-iron receptor n=1 Tax=Sporomusa ovata TaxID=2378 RepID=A0A0U1KYL5_9FIRM|nr:TonB-dependent siderophore receptor [Sporomusa ovata]EQB28216.1 ferrichrysobactin receptor [Sporomusa ovata DSM 2662]CQR71754.1 Ferrichrome-iron receptor [Sporomusa ovata]
MKKSNKAMRMQLGGFTLVLALSCWTPGGVLAEENQGAAAAQQEQAVDQQQDQQNKPTVTVDEQQTTKVPVAEVEVKAEKEKKKKLTIGQQDDAEGVNDYVVTHSSTGSKSDVANKDLPQLITVIGQKIMEEQRPTNFNDALANVAGISVQSVIPNYLGGCSFNVRGFSSDSTINVNGLWDTVSAVSNWTGNLDRIEVLKGPAAVLYGEGSPGGIINFITKKPLPYYQFTVGTDFRSWGGKSQDIDLSLPLTKDKKWLSRTIVQNADYRVFQRRNISYKRFDGSVIVQGQPRTDTIYTFEFQFHDHDGSSTSAWVPTKGTILPPYHLVPYDGYYYNPKRKIYYIDRSISGQVEHKFNDIWTVRSALRYSKSSTDWFSQGGTTLDLKTLKVSQSWSRSIKEADVFSWDTTANAKFKGWGLEHSLTTGFTWSRFTGRTLYSASGPMDSVDLYNPVFPDTLSDPTYLRTNFSPTHTYRLGSYLNDIIELTPKLKITGGISYTGEKEDGENNNRNRFGTSHRVGATYEAAPGITWFTGYSTSYEPHNPWTNDAGKTFYFEPETGDQIEGGLKIDQGNRASITMSVYRIRRKNIPYTIYDETGAGNDQYLQIGEEKSRGFDLDATYVIRPGWNLLMAYSHCNARIEKDDYYKTGTVFPNSPLNTFRLWSTYEFQEGPRKGLGFGGGVTYVGKRTVSWNNSRGWIDAYTTIDGVIYYKTKDWRYSLNAYNLTNRKYWWMGGSTVVCAGAPRNFVFRIEKSFS